MAVNRKLSNEVELLLQKCLQSGNQNIVNSFGPAFPDNKHLPAIGTQFSKIASISCGVCRAFGFPEFCVRCRSYATKSASVRMPKTAVNEDDFSATRQHQIGFARQIAPMQSVSKSHAVHNCTYNEFRFRVPRSNARHVEGSLRCRMHIRHGRLESTAAQTTAAQLVQKSSDCCGALRW